MDQASRDQQFEKLVGDGYPREAVERVRDWTELCSIVMAIDPDDSESLCAGVKSLNAKAESLYPNLLEGKPVSMHPSDLGEGWTIPNESIEDRFLELTGSILLTGVDGPRATHFVMLEKLGEMAEWFREHPETCERVRKGVEGLFGGKESPDGH